METVPNTPKVISSKEGTKFNIVGHEVTVKLHSGDGSDNYVFEMISPPGSGIPPHVHQKEDEMIYILEGEFEVMVGGEVFKAASGDCLKFCSEHSSCLYQYRDNGCKNIMVCKPGQEL